MQNAYSRSPGILGAIRPASSWLSLPQIRVVAAAALVLGLTLWVYSHTLSPTINSFDSAELITGAYTLGIVHAPGYPLYMLLAHLATRLPWGSIAYNVNFMSAVFGSLAAAVLFYASWRLSRALWASVLAALLLAFSRMYWSEAVVAEVYTLNALLIGGVILAAILFYEKSGGKTLIAVATTFGLSLAHHPSALLLGPGLVALVLSRVRGHGINGKAWLAALFGLTAPMFLYLYLPLRYAADPALNYVGDYFDMNLASAEGLIWMVSGRMFSQELFGRSLVEGLGQILSLGLSIWLNFFGAGLVLALYGLVRLRTRRALALFLGGSAAAILLFFAFYDMVDNAQMLLPVLVLLTPPLAVGLDRFMRRARPRLALHGRFQPLLAGVLAFGVAALLIAANWRFADRSGDWSAYDFAQRVMAEVDPGALILAQWTSATPLEYMQIVEGLRPDVEILDRGLMALGIRDKLNREGTEGLVDANSVTFAALTERVSREMSNRPVYIMENDPVLRGSFCYEELDSGIFRLFQWSHSRAGCLLN